MKVRNHSQAARALLPSKGVTYKPATVKSRRAREWGGWGRLSDDGPGHYNPGPERGPLGQSDGCRSNSGDSTGDLPPTQGGITETTSLEHEGRRQTGQGAAYAGSRLNPNHAQEALPGFGWVRNGRDDGVESSDNIGIELQLAAVEEDSGSEVGEAAEAMSAFD